MQEREMRLNSGEMPRTDFRYEEFERLLGSYHATMLPLRDGEPQDQADFEAVSEILKGFADRHQVQKPEEAIAQPRTTQKAWGQPAEMSCFSVVDLIGSFSNDFGVGVEPGTVDREERMKLGRLVLGVLHRHGVIQAGFEEIDGAWTPVSIARTNRDKFYKPFATVLQN